MSKEIVAAQALAHSGSRAALRRRLEQLEHAYTYGEQPLVRDETYNAVAAIYQEAFGDRDVIGAPSDSNVELPRHMGSLNKVATTDPKAEGRLARWCAANGGPYCVTGKADGVSVYVRVSAGEYELFSRGDGSTGRDLSGVAPTLLAGVDTSVDIELRGEIVMKRDAWREACEKSGSMKVARSLVCGILNRKSPTVEEYRGLSLVAYEVYTPEVRRLRPREQLAFLSSLGYEPVESCMVEELSMASLSRAYSSFVSRTLYDLDGLVFVSAGPGPEVNLSGNPTWALAFKENSLQAEVEVVGVEYSQGTTGALKPTVVYKPVELAGSCLRRASVFNVAYVEERGIGEGAVLTIIKSGDVIPTVLRVVTAAAPDLPDKAAAPQPAFDYGGHPAIPYSYGSGAWKESKRDAFPTEMVSEGEVKKLTAFFTGVEVPGMRKATVRRIYERGIRGLPEMLRMERDDFEKVGFGKKTSATLAGHLARLKEEGRTLAQVIGSAPHFRGIQRRTAELLCTSNPELLSSAVLVRPPRVAQQAVDHFLAERDAFVSFLEETKDTLPIREPAERGGGHGPLRGLKVVFTGTMPFGRKEATRLATEAGATVCSTVSSDTAYLVAASTATTKAKRAAEIGIKVISPTEFLGIAR